MPDRHGSEQHGDGLDRAVGRAAGQIADADGLVIAAGAGIGVDSGLPDFRGDQGFWRAYPALGRQRIAFESIANPAAFRSDPALAWGFYAHRLGLYRATVPHSGFHRLRAIANTLPHGAFMFTSNVDGQFQKAGFDAATVCEVHGSIHHLQCIDACHAGIWTADDFRPVVDDENCRLVSPFPRCPRCGAIARPNILMFGDWDWVEDRSARQQQALDAWLRRLRRPVVIELGAGTHVATVRHFSERFAPALIRVNPTAPEIPDPRGVSLRLGAAEALERIAVALNRA